MSRNTYVYEFDNKEYILTKKEADEVDEYSNQEEDDDKFNAWFRDFAKQRGINPRFDASNSQYWSRIDSSFQNSTARHAMIQRAVTTLVRVVSPEILPSQVAFADNQTSYVDLRTRKITLPVGPIKGEDIHKDIDAVAGFAVHEAYHLNHSSDVLYPFMSEIEYGSTVGVLANVLEDFRINRLGNKNNPGFEHYIDETMDYVYNKAENNYQLPDEWPKRDATAPFSLDDKANVAGQQIAALFAPLQYRKHVGDGSDKPYADKIKSVETIVKEYTDKGASATSTDLDLAINQIKSMLDVVVKRQDQVPVNTPVPMSVDGALASDEGLAEQETQNVAAAAAADMQSGQLKDNQFAKGAGIGDDTVTVVRPLVGMGISRIPKMTGDVVKADAALRLTKTRERNEDRYMRSGDLDEDELYRLYLNDDRVFINVTEEVEEEAAVYMCVDVSGSMDGMRLNIASKMAWLLAHSMSKKKHVKTKVFAHTSSTYVSGLGFPMGAGGTVIYRIHEKGEDFKRLNWLLNVEQGGTPDEVALAVLGKEILEEEVPNKYIIMLNDGSPNRPDAVADITKALDKKGIYVIQIAVAGSLRSEQQSKMYKYFVTYHGVDQTIRDLAKILDKVR